MTRTTHGSFRRHQGTTRRRTPGGRASSDSEETVRRGVSVEAGLDLDKKCAFAPDEEGEILKPALATQGAAIVHPALKRADDAAARPRAR